MRTGGVNFSRNLKFLMWGDVATEFIQVVSFALFSTVLEERAFSISVLRLLPGEYPPESFDPTKVPFPFLVRASRRHTLESTQ